MTNIVQNRKAKDVLTFLLALEKQVHEADSRAAYLFYLASVHPKHTGFEELESVLGLSKSQVSRVTRGMYKLNQWGKEGLDMIDITFDLHNPRIKLVSLNAKGQAAVTDMLKLWG